MTISNTKQALDIKLAFKKYFESRGTVVKEDNDELYTNGIRKNEQCTFKEYYLKLYELRDKCLEMKIYTYIDDVPPERYVELCVELSKYLEKHPRINVTVNLYEGVVIFQVKTTVQLFSKDSVVINEGILGEYIMSTIDDTEAVELALKDFLCK